jgi:hypothetical protein
MYNWFIFNKEPRRKQRGILKRILSYVTPQEAGNMTHRDSTGDTLSIHLMKILALHTSEARPLGSQFFHFKDDWSGTIATNILTHPQYIE